MKSVLNGFCLFIFDIHLYLVYKFCTLFKENKKNNYVSLINVQTTAQNSFKKSI